MMGGIILQAREEVGGAKVAVIDDAATAPVGHVQTKLDEVLAGRPTGDLVQGGMAFRTQEIDLRAARCERILHQNFGSIGNTGGGVMLPANQDLRLKQPFWRECQAVVEDPLAFPLVGVCAGFRQDEIADSLIETGILPLVILPIGAVAGAELMADMERNESIPLRTGDVFADGAAEAFREYDRLQILFLTVSREQE